VDGEWTPLAVLDGPLVGSAFEVDGVTLMLLANASTEDVAFRPDGAGWSALHAGDRADEITVPAGGVAAAVRVAAGSQIPDEVASVRAALVDAVAEADTAFPLRSVRRLPAPRGGLQAPREGLARASVSSLPSGDAFPDAVTVPAGEYTVTVRFRMRETGMYDGAPYVDEWKPLPPRLHDQRTLERSGALTRPVQVAVTEVSEAEYALFLDAIGEKTDAADAERPATNMTFARAREYAAWAGGRLPTEDEWQLAARMPGFARRTPEVWNWTESEHSDGRTRFVMLKGGSVHLSEGSDWYFDGGVKPPEFSAKLLLPGLGQDASPSIGFRICREVTS
jgi:formylglycine-generating enzyme required for sulfatase activity